MKNRLLSILLILALLLSLTSTVSGSVEKNILDDVQKWFFSEDTLEQGTYVYFGSFEGIELVWYVCETDENEALLFCVTPFLAGEFDATTNIYTYTHASFLSPTQVQYGSSSWRTSDLRTFLNSGAEEVVYTDVCFDYSGLWGGTSGSFDSSTQNNQPSYAQYGGFLNPDNFMEEETALINPTVHNTLVAHMDDAHQGENKTPDFANYGKGAENAHTLIDAGYSYVVTEDYMYPLSSEQYNKYVEQMWISGECVDSNWDQSDYWLRDAAQFYWNYGIQYYWVGMYQNFAGKESYYTTEYYNLSSPVYKFADESINIRPACKISLEYIEDLSGDGTYSDPYRMTIDPMVMDRPEYTEGNIYRQHPSHLTFTVVAPETIENEDGEYEYTLHEGIKVEAGGVEYETNEFGQVTIPYPRGGATISKEGFVTRTLRGSQLENTPTVYLSCESSKPVISGVWIDNVDVLYYDYKLDLMNSGTQTVRVEIKWGDGGPDTLVLRQGTEIVEVPDGISRVTWSDHFDVSELIEVIAIDSDGRETRRGLKLKVDTVKPEQLNGYRFTFGNGFGFTLGEEAGALMKGSQVKIGVWSPLTFDCRIENGKVYILLGVQGGWDNSSGKMKPKDIVLGMKKIMNNIGKNASDAAKGYRELQSFMKDNGMSTGVGKGSLVIDVGLEALGFLEGYLNSKGEIIFLDGGYVLSANGGFSYGVPFAIGTVPGFFEVDLKSNVTLQGNMGVIPDAQRFYPDEELRWKTVVNAGVGAGLKDVLSLSGGIEGQLDVIWEYKEDATDYVIGRKTLRPYIKGNFAVFEVKPEFPEMYNRVIFEYPKTKQAEHSDSAQMLVQDAVNLYDPSDYTLQEVTQACWLGNRTTKDGDSTLLTGISDTADPQLIRLSDGKLALLYVAQNPNYSDVNGQQLYITIYDGSSWSAPKLLRDNAMADASPYVVNVNGETKIAWMELETLPEGSTLEDASTRIMTGDISSDGTYSGISTPVSVDGTLAYQPVICDNGNELSVLWQGNTNGDWFSATGNAIYTSQKTSSGWSAANAAYTDLGMITSLTADYEGDELRIAWAMDTDGDIYTSDDIEIFVNGQKITDNAVAESNLRYCDGTLYWYADGKLYADGEEILASGEGTLSPVFQVIKSDSAKAILFTANDGLRNTLYVSWCTEDQWSAPTALTDGTDYIYDYSATLDKDNNLTVALCTKTVNAENEDNPYGEGTLKVIAAQSGIDLQIVYADTDNSCYVAGKDQVFDLSVINQGNKPAAGIVVELTDQTNGYSEQHIKEIPLAPGESAEFSCGIGISKVVQDKEITIRVSPLEAEDLTPGDNETTAILHWDDLSVENTSWGYRSDGKVIIYGGIVNRGYTLYENVTVSLRKDTADGTILDSLTLEALDHLGQQGVAFAVEPEADTVYYITVDADDSLPANNSAFVGVTTATGESPYEPVDPDAPFEPETPTEPNAPTEPNTPSEPNAPTEPDTPSEPDTPEIPFENPFTDVKENDYFYEPVLWAVGKGVTNGMSATIFAPNANCTRGQIVTFLWRACGSPEPTSAKNNFKDVKAGEYYYKAVLWAVENGITTGLSATSFGPNATCTRAQVATFLWRAQGEPEPISTNNPFSDVKTSDYYFKAVLWAVENEVTQGVGGGKFAPNASCTRGQIVTFLYRANNRTTPAFDEKSYEIVVNHCTWLDAQAAAAAKGGKLVTFDSIEEYRFVVALIKQKGDPKAFYYVGARRDENGKTYHWVDEKNQLAGTALNDASSWCNSLWQKGEPNLQWGGKPETVAVLYDCADESRWCLYDGPSDQLTKDRQYAYIIEY